MATVHATTIRLLTSSQRAKLHGRVSEAPWSFVVITVLFWSTFAQMNAIG